MSASATNSRATSLVALLLVAVTLWWAGPVPPASAALPPSPRPALHHVLHTSPFAGSAVSTKDNEGSAYVPRDGSLWMADDDGNALHEVNAATGALKRTVSDSTLAATRQLGGTNTAGVDRVGDLESLAYDQATDTLYAFSGSCCTAAALPTAFRFKRTSGSLRPESFQPLLGADFTGAAWNPGDSKIYVGNGGDLRSYDYPSNATGSPIGVGVSGILGMDFTDDGKDLVIARSGATITRVNWATKRPVSGWSLNLSSFGLQDTRAVEVIADRLWVSDGSDLRLVGDPLRHAVFVIDVGAPTAPPTKPTASFTATPTGGAAPLTVAFQDTSTGSPTTWRWTFGDGTTSSVASPTHTYAQTGSFTATLTASNSGGSTTASRQITVTASSSPPPPPATTPPPPVITPPAVVRPLNLVGNAGFETGVDGWGDGDRSGVRLARVQGGHTGWWSVRVRRTSGQHALRLDDTPGWAPTSRAGTYRVSLWVRAAHPGAALRLRLREERDGSGLGRSVAAVTLTDQWQRVSTTLTPRAPGRSSIDVTATVRSPDAKTSFRVDDVELTVS